MGEQRGPERQNNLQAANLARKAKTGTLLPDSITPSLRVSYVYIPVSTQVWAFKTATSQSILLDKRFLETMLSLLAVCSLFQSLSFQTYINCTCGGAWMRPKDEDTHPTVCVTQMASCSCKKDSAQFPSINASLFVPGGLPITCRNTSPQAL